MTATREECMRNAGRTLAATRALSAAMEPRRAAEEAHYAGGPSVDEIEARIRARRAQSAEVAA